MKFHCKLSQVHPHVFVLEVDNVYDLGMLFLRVQEFYESANPKFQRQKFSLLSYMDWYAKEYSEEKGFTYGGDFNGFNVPSIAIKECYMLNAERTVYDKLFLDICQRITDLGVEKFYLLGCVNGDTETLEHEFAHALFFVDNNYRETMSTLVEMLPCKDEVFNLLKDEFEYATTVHVDETQAYFSTGFTEHFKEELGDKMEQYTLYAKPFQKVFQEWRKEITEPKVVWQDTVNFFDNEGE